MTKFVYLGSIVNMANILEREISLRIKNASNVFYKRDKRLWSQHGSLFAIRKFVCNFVSIIVCLCDLGHLPEAHEEAGAISSTVSPPYIQYPVVNAREWR